jgi:secreted PhoX family phosphatase
MTISSDPLHGKLTSHTRRDFIRGIAAAGASTAGVAAAGGGGLHMFAEQALAGGHSHFGDFTAIAASSDDAFEVPPGYRADVVISWGDVFRGANNKALRYGFNNDFLAYFPLRGGREGLLFVNHEYPDPFFLHGYKPDGSPKTAAQVQEEQDSVGNSILHVKRRRGGGWKVVSPSDFNRRIYGDRPQLEFTGPLAGAPGVGASANGSVGNCSGGVTPWGTALSCEENFDDYGLDLEFDNSGAYGWHQYGGQPGDAEYHPENFKKYGWVCEHDPYDPDSVGRKHTALGRFRHENTAFRQERGKRFVLYMGDDKTNEGVYKFVSARAFKPRYGADNHRILEEGQLYIARWEPEGRRRFAAKGDVDPINATEGAGHWVPVPEEALDDTATKLRGLFGEDEFNAHFATNRPEDVEVAEDGSVFIALTNNSTEGVFDSHGSVRRLREKHNDPEALEFRWRDYAAGGPTQSGDPGTAGFSSPDNLVFDRSGNLWVVTDISSSSLNQANEYGYHKNNAMFFVPTSGPNKGVAFRFANGPAECELTGPYFTPDGKSLFVNVQHPGELTGDAPDAPGVFGQEATYTSWWPEGNKSTADNPATPRPSTVVISRDD